MPAVPAGRVPRPSGAPFEESKIAMNHRLLRCLVALSALAGFGGPALAEGDVFRYPEDTRPASLLPFFAEDMTSVRMVELLFDPLVFINKRGDVEGALATSWKVDEDQMGISFVLREGVKWHDGQPFTADDVVFTLRAARDPKTIFNAKSKYSFIKEAEAQGQYGVKVTFNRPVNEPERRFLFKVLPQHAFGGNTAISRKDKFARAPIGTGPFKLDKFSLRSVDLIANGDYWAPAKVSQVSMQHTPDKAAQVNLLQYSGGEAGVQAVIFLQPKNLPLFENSETVVLEPYHTVSWWYMAYNHNSGALAERPVREAIALAVNREELLAAHLGRGDTLSGPFTESSPFYNFQVEGREPDLERARQMLEDAGYKIKGGMRQKGKNKLKFKFVIDKELASGQELFLGLQAQLKKVGIQVDAEYVDHAKYREQVFTKGGFDLTMNVWSFEEVEDVYPLFHSTGVMNFIGYKNKDIDALLDQAQATKDYKKYKEIMKELHARLNEDLPYFFLWSLDVYSGLSKNLKNVFIQPYYYFTSFEEWELRR